MKPKTAMLILWICWVVCVVGNGVLVGILTHSILAGIGAGGLVTVAGMAAVAANAIVEGCNDDDE